MFKDSKNITDGDRVVRMSLGIVLLVIAIFGLNDMLKVLAIVLATYGMVTGIVAYCPVSEVLLGKSRIRRPKHRPSRKHRRR